MLSYTTNYQAIGRSSASLGQKAKKADMGAFGDLLEKLLLSQRLPPAHFRKEISYWLQVQWEKTKGFPAEVSSAKNKGKSQVLLKERLKAIEGALSEVARCNPLAKFEIYIPGDSPSKIIIRSIDNNFSASFAIDLSDTKRPVKVCAKTGLQPAETPNMENQLMWLAERIYAYGPKKP